MRALRPTTLLLATAFGAGLGIVAFPSLCDARVRDNAQLNYYFDVPDTWSWLSDVSPWSKHGVVEVADRRLEELKDKSVKPTGEGGRTMLSVQEPVPASLDADYETWIRDWQIFYETTKPPSGSQRSEEDDAKLRAMRAKIDDALVALAQTADVQRLLLIRFVSDEPKDSKPPFKPAKPDPKKPAPAAPAGPSVTITGDQDIGGRPGIPAVKLEIEANALNMDGVEAKCLGRMFVWVIGKKLYRLVMWVWPTEHDYEGLKSDLDNIELSFGIPRMTAIPRKPPAAVDPGTPAGPSKLGGDSGEEKTFKEPSMSFEVFKPKGLKSLEIDRTQTAQRNLGFDFRAQSGGADLIIDFLSYTTFEIDTNLVDVWKNFLKLHPAGALETFAFPMPSPKDPYLSPADSAKKKEIKRPLDLSKDKPTKADLERMGIIEDVKNAKVGKVRLKEAWRACLKGVAQRIGEDVQLHYFFQSEERFYVLRVYARGGAYETMKKEIAAVLKGLTLIEPK